MLSPEDRKIGIAANISDRILEFVREHTQADFEQMTKVNEEFEREPTNGIVLTVEFSEAQQVLPLFRDAFTEHGYLVFYHGHREDNFVEIGILKSMDPYDILRLKGTNGLNYELETEDIINHIKEWENVAHFSILFASFNSVELLFHELPIDPRGFLEHEVRPFCFDFGTQSIMGEEDVAQSFIEYKKLSLWWD